MDDPTQNPHLSHQNTQSADDPQVGSAVAVPSPVGSLHKEAGPARSMEAPVAEVLTPSEKAPELPKEVEDAGVEVSKNHEVPDLTMHDKNFIDHAPSIAPVPTQPSGMVQLPLTEEKATETLKHKDSSKGITWLAESVLRQLKIMHEKMKGGH